MISENRPRLVPNRMLCAWLVLALAVSGCAREEMAPRATASEARQALSNALEDWKQGRTATSAPAPRLMDPDRDKGRQVVEYAIDGDGNMLGQNLQCRVNLTLKDSSGKLDKKSVVYLVSGGQPPVITRQDADY